LALDQSGGAPGCGYASISAARADKKLPAGPNLMKPAAAIFANLIEARS
jgi:hypothetical protein